MVHPQPGGGGFVSPSAFFFFNDLFLVYVHWCFICVCPWNWGYGQWWAAMWVLGIESGSSGSTASALNLSSSLSAFYILLVHLCFLVSSAAPPCLYTVEALFTVASLHSRKWNQPTGVPVRQMGKGHGVRRHRGILFSYQQK